MTPDFPVSLRNHLRRQLCEWDSSLKNHGMDNLSSNSAARVLAKLFGFHNFSDLISQHGNFKVKDQQLHNRLLALAGPHGYTLFKAMRAKQDD